MMIALAILGIGLLFIAAACRWAWNSQQGVGHFDGDAARTRRSSSCR